jgi:hypothetical protein
MFRERTVISVGRQRRNVAARQPLTSVEPVRDHAFRAVELVMRSVNQSSLT